MKNLAQKGVAHILLLIAAVGVIGFILVSSSAQFKTNPFALLFPKPASKAAIPNGIDMAYPCGFTNPAFCDDFSQGPAPVKGRGNDLDFRTWSFNRISGNNNGRSNMFTWATIPSVEHCLQTFTNVTAPNDSFFCGSEVPEPEHWMEAFSDGGSYVVNNGRIRQPFDFTGRTGMIQYGVDNKNSGSHGWWLETWVTDTPIPVPHEHDGSNLSDLPRNGIGVRFTDNCNVVRPADFATHGWGVTGASDVDIITDYQVRRIPNELGVNRNCVRTQDDRSNMIQIRLSTTRIEVYNSDAGSNVIRRILAANISPPLPFSVGFVNFIHSGYSADKAGANRFQTYHWHDMGFDGPIHPTPRAYEISDSLTRTAGGLNTGYMVQADGTIYDGARSFPAFTFQNVDLTNADSARLNFITQRFSPGNHIFYRFNDGPERTYDYPGPSSYHPESVGHSMAVELADLQPGTNTLRLRSDGTVLNAGPNTAQLGNIELEVVPAGAPTPAPAAGMIPCSQFQLLMGVMSDMVMGDDPCSGMPLPSITPTPTPAPTPVGTQTVDFNGLAVYTFLSQYPTGVINWGGNWFVARPVNQFTSNNLHFSSSTGTSRSFNFVTPRRLISLDMINHASVSANVIISCSGNPNVVVNVPAGELLTNVNTNWTNVCTTVTITSSAGWVVHYNNLVIQ